MSIQHVQYPGHPSFENKLNATIDQANIFETMRGDEVFINVRKGPGGLIVSLNWQALLSRIPKAAQVSLQQFKVVGYAPLVSGVMPPWSICQAVLNDGTTSSQNRSVGIVQAHAIGEIINVLPVGGIFNSGSALKDNNNKSIGLIEVGNYGQYFSVDLAMNTSSGLEFTYDMKIKGTSQLLKGNLSPEIPLLTGWNKSSANVGTGKFSNGGIPILVIDGEILKSC